MRLARHRRTLAATAVAALVLTVGACGTSFNAQTNQQYQASIGADDRAADVQVLNGLLVTGENGSATLSATLINTTDTDQRLTAVSLVSSAGIELQLVSTDTEDLVIAPGEARTLGLADDSTQRLGSKVYTTFGIDTIGLYYTLTLTFADAGDLEIKIPSVARNAIYADVALPPTGDPAENLKESGADAMERSGEHGESGGH
ncbi:copper chaperone PCu(A)C [Aeromicrobium sp. Leaf350]|uniref:copper chaperone PCu(A)C n=1 Tax=Aeromicrobium sp. Leaf350 TaxID=2876565 RepID=UPI001E395472|nr:copper chaperone PCu(A)C [Aeromicrobium sp. Leaf350]